MFSSIGDIIELLVNQSWEAFRSNVMANPDFFRHLAGAISACSQLNGMTLLHAIVRYNPPLDIVARMIEFCPHMPAAKDCLQRTPLHVAAGLKASASLLDLLASAYPAACDAQDEGNKTPLHFVCDSSCVLFEDDLFENDSIPSHEAVEVLLTYSFHAAILKDDEDMIPVEHPSDAEQRTVRLLQNAAVVHSRVTQPAEDSAEDHDRSQMPRRVTE